MELTLTVNGKPESYQGRLSIDEILAKKNLSPDRVAVALNREVVFHQEFAVIFPEIGDELEILTPMVGG